MLDDDWVVLGIEHVEARPPARPWRPADLDATLDALEVVADELTPAPLALDTFEDEFASFLDGWAHVRSAHDLPHLDEAEALARRYAEVCGGDTLVHTDIRADNVLVDAAGKAWLVDWNWPVAGAPWLDSLFTLIGPRGDGLDVDAVLASRRLLQRRPGRVGRRRAGPGHGVLPVRLRPAGPGHVAVPPRPPALAGRGLLGVAGRAPRLVSAPRAVGVRAAYSAIPPHVRDWVEATLGAPVMEAREQVGGMSPGCATRLVCADGTRAFLKAVGTELNPHTPVLFRREVMALGLLGRHPLWAGLIASYDDGDWVALLLDDVDGAHPDLTLDAGDGAPAPADRRAVRRDERAGGRPAPSGRRRTDGQALYRPGPTDFGCRPPGLGGGLRAPPRAAAGPPPPLGAGPRGPRSRDGVARLADERTDTVVHVDIRNDNLVQRSTGELVFVDWGAFGRGPAWLDPLVARLERVDSPWFDESLASSPALRAAGDEVVTSWLVGMGTFLAWRAHTAVDVNLPTLAAFRRTESRRFLGAAGP